MAAEQKVQVFSLGLPKRSAPKGKRRYRVKWAVDGRHKTRSIKTREQAERLRSQLQQAVRDGQRFDPETGEPIKWEQSTATWWSWSTEWLALKWPQWTGNTRKGAGDTVVAMTPHLVRRGAPEPPPDLSRWLAQVGVLPAITSDEKSGRESAWLDRWSIPLVEMSPGQLEVALTAATTRLDGKRMAPVVSKRRYNIVKGLLRAAVNRELIDTNPVNRMAWSAPRDSVVVNVATLPSVSDVLEIVEELSKDEAYAHYAAFFASIGLAGFRPSEACRASCF